MAQSRFAACVVACLMVWVGFEWNLLAQEAVSVSPTPAGSTAGDSRPAQREAFGDFVLPKIEQGPSLTLEEALRLADSRNFSIASARADIQRAQAELGKSWSILLPMATGSMTLTHADHQGRGKCDGGIDHRDPPSG